MPTIENYAIEDSLTRLANLPAPVRDWKIDIGEDATGELAVWVWATVDDDDLTRAVRNELREKIDRQVRHIVPDASWVYVRFRAVSEAQPR
jgi:hypothetical protein